MLNFHIEPGIKLAQVGRNIAENQPKNGNLWHTEFFHVTRFKTRPIGQENSRTDKSGHQVQRSGVDVGGVSYPQLWWSLGMCLSCDFRTKNHYSAECSNTTSW